MLTSSKVIATSRAAFQPISNPGPPNPSGKNSSSNSGATTKRLPIAVAATTSLPITPK